MIASDFLIWEKQVIIRKLRIEWVSTDLVPANWVAIILAIAYMGYPLKSSHRMIAIRH